MPPKPSQRTKIPLFYVETEAGAPVAICEFAAAQPFSLSALRGDLVTSPAAAPRQPVEKLSIAWAMAAAVRLRQVSDVNDFRSLRFET